MSDVVAVNLQGQELTSIISDVPLVSIGLMAFGTFSFLTATRRASSPDKVLFVASFLVFSAAIFDLSKVVAEVMKAGVARIGYQLEIVRDIGLATSVGLVYLFMWLFVAERPQIESQRQSQLHSGSWRRWNLLGESLKWLSLALSLVTPLLRILWHRLGSIHVRESFLTTDAIIETVLSTIFILKLLLNASLVSHDVRWKALRDYLPPIIAMVISTALSIGNLVTESPLGNVLAFADTTIGHFLLSIELYTLLLFTLMNAFYKDIKSAAAASSVDSEQELSAILIKEQTNNDIVNENNSRTVTVFPLRAHNVDRQDLGLLCSVDRRGSGHDKKDCAVPRSVREGTSPLQPNGLDSSPISVAGGFGQLRPDSKPLPNLPEDDYPSSSLYSFSSPSSGDSSLTTFNKILCHQKNLDRMISKLKILSHQGDDASKPSTNADAMYGHHSWRRPSSDASNTVRSPMSASASDISLSSFPVPPLSEVQTPRRSVGVRRVAGKSRRKARYLRDGITVAASENQGHNLPTFQDGVRREQASAVTQYNVTSFIDGKL